MQTHYIGVTLQSWSRAYSQLQNRKSDVKKDKKIETASKTPCNLHSVLPSDFMCVNTIKMSPPAGTQLV
jgi:hypothetical protein